LVDIIELEHIESDS